MNFCSDNTTGVAPEIMAALEDANHGPAMPYGEDPLTRRAEAAIAEAFETEADVFLVSTGTAANALALSVMAPPYGSVFCHAESHIECDECGAPEFFTGGAKLVLLEGENGKFDAAELRRYLAQPDHGVHHVPASAVSIAQSTEAGTVYTLEETAAIAGAAHEKGLKVHMDGARFANALVHLGCSPAEATWRVGIDALSLGASKNGALAAEAVVVFDRALAETLAYRRKRSGHLISKSRFLAAQFEAYLDGGLWLKNATHANAMAARLADALSGVKGATLRHPVEANEVFIHLPEATIVGLLDGGFQFHRWPGADSGLVRLVCAFNTLREDVDAFAAAARRHAQDG